MDEFVLYFLISSSIVLFTSIAPLALLYCGLRLYESWCPFPGSLSHSLGDWKLLLDLWLSTEILFLLYYEWTRRRLERFYPHGSPAMQLTLDERIALLERCFSTVKDKCEYVRGWFYGSPFNTIYRENFLEFLAWCCYGADYHQLVRDAAEAEHKLAADRGLISESEIKRLKRQIALLAEQDVLFQATIRALGVKVPAGRNPNVRCMRLNQDPLNPRHRPLIYYSILFLIHVTFSWYLHHVLGFKKFVSRKEQELLAFWDKQTVKSSAHAKASYWYLRPEENEGPEDKIEDPIVLVHGIGVGLFGYALFIHKMVNAVMKRNPSQAIFAVEMPHVSSLMFPIFKELAEDVPTMEEMVDLVETMLRNHQPKSSKKNVQATFIGHSLGSAVVTWLIRKRPNLVKHAVLIDPICFMLHLHDLAFNFIYRKPKHWVELLIWWYASRELYISWTLARCFHWHQNVLYMEDIPRNLPVSVILGGSDAVVPGRHVREYLLEHENVIEKRPEEPEEVDLSRPVDPSSNIILHYFERRNHAEFLFAPNFEAYVLDVVLKDVHLRKVINRLQQRGRRRARTHPIKVSKTKFDLAGNAEGLICPAKKNVRLS